MIKQLLNSTIVPAVVRASGAVAIACLIPTAHTHAQEDEPLAAAQAGPTYADLAMLADSSDLVIRAEIRKQATVEPERAAGLAPGYARLYIVARTKALLAGRAAVGEELTYLADVPLNGKGKVPKLKRLEVLLFANPVAGRPGAIQLISPTAQLQYSLAIESRLRPILTELASADAPPAVTGVRDAFSVSGNLVGESETQIFLNTKSGSPASITVLRRPGRAPVWGVSWGEIIDQAALPPEPQTLGWYRLACSLPDAIAPQANYSSDEASRRLTAADYAYVIDSLGPCERWLPAF